MNLRGMLKMALAKRPRGTLLKVGEVAPPFEAEAHTGEQIRLADYAGRRVVLWFYPRADTPGCTMEGCGFRDAYARYRDKNVAVLGVSFDAPAENRRFAEKFHFPFPLLSDSSRSIAIAYGACDDPQAEYPRRITYVISPQGTIEQAFDHVSVRSHASTLLDRM